MDYERLKNDMKQLWKDTFHDADNYIDLVFDSYFRPEFCAWKYEDNVLVAALLGISYEFGSLFGCLKGLYLCGLATHPDFRGHGVMSELLEEINDRAEKAGFDFTFLIPADNGLQRYYSDRGYAAAFRNITLRYAPGHSFYKEYVAWVNSNEKLLKMERLKAFENLHVRRISIDESSWRISPDATILNQMGSLDSSLNQEGCRDLNILQSDSLNNDNMKFLSSYEIYNLMNIDDENYTATGDNLISDFKLNFSSKFKNKNINYYEDFLQSLKGCILKSDDDENIIFHFNDIYSFVYAQESGSYDLDLIHTPLDFLLVLQENNLSGGQIFLVSSLDNRIRGLAVVSSEDYNQGVVIKRIYTTDQMSRYKLLHEISLSFPNVAISVVTYPDYSAPTGIADIFYGATMPANGNVPEIGYTERVFSQQTAAKTYGMIRILSFSHFLEFLTAKRSDVKYSILVKDRKSGDIIQYDANRGNLTVSTIPHKNGSSDSRKDSVDDAVVVGKRNEPVLTENQLQVLLMRKSDTEDAVFMAFDLPAMQLNMSLLLD